MKLLTVFACFLLLFVSACGKNEKTSETTSTTSKTTNKEKPATPAANTNIGQVNVFLEVSGSMKGFMPTNKAEGITEFQKTIDPFLATIQQSNIIQNKGYFEVREKPYPINYEQLSRTVRYGIQQSASSTTIPAILDSIISQNQDGVNILISDFIYSPENNRAVSFVSTDIYRVLSKAKQQGQAVSVFAATSDFDGTFYPAEKSAQRTIANCCDTPVPYYVWVMGKPELVSLFNRELVKNTFPEQVHSGFTFEAPAYSVLDKYMPAGNWYCVAENGSCQAITISDMKAPVEMIVGANFNGLPSAFTSAGYLKQNLKIQAENTDAQITNIYPAAQFRTLPGVSGKNTDPLKPFTHFIKIKFTKLNAPQTEMHLQLANQRPTWVQQWTTPNDSQINQEGAKTFNLAGIMDGVERAFGAGTGGNIFDIAIGLQKEK
ncbi:hypothetical protein [Adhaeribacter rhizoryzae]|uniref:VWA domain-containing protein n=1 Tax=Adhaeribacter rhizoryzae TaxID=2607907 RepID=A0A5M6D9K4_9BACT|nr:hypothetical protein [Adhaeribacter rhizoryzae]KAA5544238.1 hypothetical protein F0145_15140 [Adhaeribacter rhizoryzae]